MFCFQCQETSGGQGCSRVGVCGKTAEVADLQDLLIAELKKIALTRPVDREIGRFLVKALFATITNADFDPASLEAKIAEARSLVGDCGDAARIDVPLGVLAEENEDVRSLKELITYGVKGVAAYAEHAAVLGFEDDEIYAFVGKALATVAGEPSVDELLALALECGSVAVKTTALLDQANTTTFGTPQGTTVDVGVGTRPGILVSGHDLLDLKELLEQSADAGVDVYTHSEMLPAHGYPELKKFPHLRGNYGGAWHAQGKEFGPFNGPIVLTTNCLTPPRDEYRDRLFTTGPVAWPGVKRIGERPQGGQKDFSEVIALAKTCAPPTELETGTVATGFARDQILAVADKVVEAVKAGKIKRFVVMAGCDGRAPSRKYFTEVAQKLPQDCVILTAGCAKYRYNKLNLGDIDGIPRVLDAGQCNDSYSLAVVALKLKEVFGLDDVNDLPLSFDLGWYEQKAVAVLLALLSLGFKGIRLGPTLPAFVSPGVLKVLVENFDVKPTTTADPDADVAAIVAGK